MNKWSLRNWPILPKMLLSSFLGVVLILTVAFLYFIPYIENSIMEGRKGATRKVVEVAHKTLEQYYDRAMRGELAMEDAQKQAIAMVKTLRYSGVEYFWINDLEPRMVMHPIASELDGKPLGAFADPNGVKLFQEFIRVTETGSGGFVAYMWPKPDDRSKLPQPKISYVKRFKPWAWIIGSGVYLDDIEKELNALRNLAMIGALFFVLVTITLTYLVGRSITRRLNRVISGLQDVAQGRGDMGKRQSISITSLDEIGALCTEFNSLMLSINDLNRFRKVIEEDENANDVYSRLWTVSTQEINIDEAIFYEVDESHNIMRLAYPLNQSVKGVHCRDEILDDCSLCKARRTGNEIVSFDFPQICKQFIETESTRHHVCVPMIVSGTVMGVAQFIFSQSVRSAADQNAIHDKVDKVNQYLKEALPVIETKRLTATLRESALKDPLTGLHNRRYLQESARNLCAGIKRRGKGMGLLMGDLDYFKQVNDTHGHDVGDAILIQTAKLLQSCVREADLVARFGGEEFLILLVDVERKDVEVLSEKIRKQVEDAEFPVPGDLPLKKTISIGISMFPDDDDSFWRVLKYADVALYKAKEQGRNQTVFFKREMWQDPQV
ncbi:MAG: diguanylate cyclase [Magnetococcales bacterium]|nr:diguanylate cyclase [Magnetococcales bacterium]